MKRLMIEEVVMLHAKLIGATGDPPGSRDRSLLGNY